MSLRGKAAIIGLGETPHRRAWPGRTERGLCAEAAAMAIADAGLTKDDIDGLITFGGMTYPGPMAEYIGIKPTHFAAGTSMMGCSSGVALTVAASVVHAGIAKNILCVFGGGRDPAAGAGIYLGGTPSGAPGGAQLAGGNTTTEFEFPWGKAVSANTGYGFLYTRHMHTYGTKSEQIALVSVRQRFNTQANPRSAFRDQPITLEDVMNSRYINEPIHILECVMPVAGAAAFVVTSAESAKGRPNPPVYLLGAGVNQGSATFWMADDMLTMPSKISAASAYEMAGYGPKDMQFAEFYDCYTILCAVSLEDAGFCAKGDIGPWLEATDTTYKGDFPVNTDGGQLAAGQLNPAGASGSQQIVEAVRQISGRAGENQVARHDLCLVNL